MPGDQHDIRANDLIECTCHLGGTKSLPKASLHFRPSVYAVVVHQNQLLVVTRRRTGRYFLPGGGVELGERLETALQREVKEETGLEIEVGPLGSWSLTYDDASRLSSVTYPGGTDSFTYNAFGQRMRASLDGTVYRYVYNGQRVVEETNDAGSVLARHTTANGSYYSPWLHMWRSEDVNRFPLFDAVGTARGLVDASATITDSYVLDSFGTPTAAATTTVNPYRFGGAWGYITDPSGLQQLGARFYWPELGRFIQQDPIGDGVNWYAYAGNNPISRIDPYGLAWYNDWGDFTAWYSGGMGGASAVVDTYVLGGSTQQFGSTAGLYDSGIASKADLAGAGANWGGRVAIAAVVIEQVGANIVGAINSVLDDPEPTWPCTPEEMDDFLGFEGTRVPDTPKSPGRNKVDWCPSDNVSITYEEHPYHDYRHMGPHWHLDTPGNPHQYFEPGDPIPGF